MAGRHVTTTASKQGEALVRSLGADEVIDYTSDDLSRFGKDFDAGFDLIGGETLDRMFKIMKPETRIVSVEDWRWSGLFAASGLTRI
jgi:alcohol dehydrogenase